MDKNNVGLIVTDFTILKQLIDYVIELKTPYILSYQGTLYGFDDILGYMRFVQLPSIYKDIYFTIDTVSIRNLYSILLSEDLEETPVIFPNDNSSISYGNMALFNVTPLVLHNFDLNEWILDYQDIFNNHDIYKFDITEKLSTTFDGIKVSDGAIRFRPDRDHLMYLYKNLPHFNKGDRILLSIYDYDYSFIGLFEVQKKKTLSIYTMIRFLLL